MKKFMTVVAALLLCCAPALASSAGSDGMLRVKLTRLGAPSTITFTADCDLRPDEGGDAIPAGNAVTASATDGVLTIWNAAGEQVY